MCVLLSVTVCMCVYACVCVGGVRVHVALSDLPSGLYGPNQMVGNINFTITSPPPPPPLLPFPPLSLYMFSSLLAPPSSSPPSLLPSSLPYSLRRCDYVPPLSTSDLRGSVCVCE